jgi:HSP20 family protein
MWTNRLFEQMDRIFGPVGFDAEAVAPAFPALNVWEDQDNIFVEAELPGLHPDDIEASVADGDQLTIAGERKPNGNGRPLRRECWYGRFSRTVTLPAEVNADRVEAAHEAGVLTLTLPKMEEAKPKRITVKAVDPAALPAAKK